MKKIYFRDVENILFSSADCSESDETTNLQRIKMLRSIVDRNLTKKQKCYIMLYYKENKTVSEIAQKFGVLPSTVSRTLTRAKKKLYNLLTGRELYSRYTSNNKNSEGSHENQNSCS